MTAHEAIEEIRAMLKTTNKMGTVFQGRPDIDRRKEAYVMAIQSLQNESTYEQIKRERDIAISQLEEIDLGLGEKTDKVKSAVETAKKIPKVIEKLEELKELAYNRMCDTPHYLPTYQRYMEQYRAREDFLQIIKESLMGE